MQFEQLRQQLLPHQKNAKELSKCEPIQGLDRPREEAGPGGLNQSDPGGLPEREPGGNSLAGGEEQAVELEEEQLAVELFGAEG